MTLFLRICGVISALSALIALFALSSEGWMAAIMLLSTAASSALFFCVADLLTRVDYLENKLKISYTEILSDPELPKKKCPHCGKEIDFDYTVCPICGMMQEDEH